MTNYAKLTEPGMEYFTNKLLQKCKVWKYNYYNRIFNILIFAIFCVLIVAILYCCKHSKKAKKINSKKEIQMKKQHTINTLKNLQEINQKVHSERISNVPFESNLDNKIFV